MKKKKPDKGRGRELRKGVAQASKEDLLEHSDLAGLSAEDARDLLHELRASRERLSDILSLNPAVIYGASVSGDYGTTFVSDNIKSQLGYEPSEFTEDSSFWADHIHPEDYLRVMAEMKDLLETEHKVVEYRFQHKDGDYRWMRDELKVIRDSEGTPVEILGSWMDITDRKQAEKALVESEQRFRELAELLPQFVFEVDLSGKFTFMNRQGIEAGGYRPEEFPWDKPAKEFFALEDQERVTQAMIRLYAGQTIKGEEFTGLTKNGATIPLSIYANPIMRDGQVVGIRGVGIDISPMKSAEAIMKGDLEEKKLLLQEIHHRVKNNLYLISSLVRLQSLYKGNKSVLEIGMELQDRIRAMAVVHEHLYQSPTMARVDANGYIRTLLMPLRHYVTPHGRGVDLDIAVESLSIELDTAIPVGLIVTELVTNSFKHAFRDRKSGKIEVSLRGLEHGELELSVRDNGVGLPKDIKFPGSGTTGLDIVEALARQLHVEVQLHRRNGTEFMVIFKDIKRRGG